MGDDGVGVGGLDDLVGRGQRAVDIAVGVQGVDGRLVEEVGELLG